MASEQIIEQWKQNVFRPIYWLEGDEPFYIDSVINYAEKEILSPQEAEFNLTIFYGRDTDALQVMNACKRYPMFSEKQVVIIKEAQFMKDVEKLEPYIQHPLNSTILIVAYKEKKIDGRSKTGKLIKQKTVFVQTKKLYENQLPEWIQQQVKLKGFGINTKALNLLQDHVGNDLSRMYNEIEKLTINLKNRKTITEDDIETYIGISKEFNVFELQDAIITKNFSKAFRIIQYFEQNPKAGPIQQILPVLYNYFSKIYGLFGLDVINEKAVQPFFYNNIYAARTALQCKNIYGYSGVEKALLVLHQYNLKSIGIDQSPASDADLMKELTVKIMS